MKTGIELIAEERKRQIEVEGYSNLSDKSYGCFELSGAAGCYIANAMTKSRKDNQGISEARFQVKRDYYDNGRPDFMDAWPWDDEYDKREKHDVKRSLVIAGALIAAELDRLLAIENESA